MAVSRREFFRQSTVAAAGAALWGSFARPALAQGQAIDPNLHILNRVTWGPRPEDIERIRQMGAAAYIDWQLDVEAIPDPLVDQFVGARQILTMPWEELERVAQQDYGEVLVAALWNRLYRAIYSERQLYELVVELWCDHFNIPIPDYLTEKIIDDREVLRRHALGRFRDLLLASAQSPAMLHYLDNAVSNAEHPNENYAREVMELHTLGVDGGYTEQDVVELARILTGWTVRDGWPGRFFFDADMHDFGEKTLLGVYFPAGRGIEEGLQALDLLASHPSTARFISMKLARRFVADFPPESLIDSAAQVFMQTGGELRSVLRHILNSPEFADSAGQKFRRPLEFLVAGMRALHPGVVVEVPYQFIFALEPMGHLPYHWFPPNGYPDVGVAWQNTNSLLHRWNAALNMGLAGEGFFDGLALNLNAVIPQVGTAGELVDAAAARLLTMPLNPADRDALIAFVVGSPDAAFPIDGNRRAERLPGLVGLLIASPYFQWH